MDGIFDGEPDIIAEFLHSNGNTLRDHNQIIYHNSQDQNQ